MAYGVFLVCSDCKCWFVTSVYSITSIIAGCFLSRIMEYFEQNLVYMFEILHELEEVIYRRYKGRRV